MKYGGPTIDAGNHTMEITVEGLEVRMNYRVEITWSRRSS